MVLELWILEDLSDGPDGHHFVFGLLACWCEDPLNLWARVDMLTNFTMGERFVVPATISGRVGADSLVPPRSL